MDFENAYSHAYSLWIPLYSLYKCGMVGGRSVYWDSVWQLTNGETFLIISGDYTQHEFLRAQKFWTDTDVDTYWTKVVTTQSISGSMVAETFLNAQDLRKVHFLIN